MCFQSYVLDGEQQMNEEIDISSTN